MRPPQTRPVFLERKGYRQRRLMDATRLLPVLGVILLAVPLLWPEPHEGDAGRGIPTSHAMIYIFGCWAGLALASFLLVRRISVKEMEAADATRPAPAEETFAFAPPRPLAEGQRQDPGPSGPQGGGPGL